MPKSQYTAEIKNSSAQIRISEKIPMSLFINRALFLCRLHMSVAGDPLLHLDNKPERINSASDYAKKHP